MRPTEAVTSDSILGDNDTPLSSYLQAEIYRTEEGDREENMEVVRRRVLSEDFREWEEQRLAHRQQLCDSHGGPTGEVIPRQPCWEHWWKGDTAKAYGCQNTEGKRIQEAANAAFPFALMRTPNRSLTGVSKNQNKPSQGGFGYLTRFS